MKLTPRPGLFFCMITLGCMRPSLEWGDTIPLVLMPFKDRKAKTREEDATLLMRHPITLKGSDITKLWKPISVALIESAKNSQTFKIFSKKNNIAGCVSACLKKVEVVLYEHFNDHLIISWNHHYFDGINQPVPFFDFPLLLSLSQCNLSKPSGHIAYHSFYLFYLRD